MQAGIASSLLNLHKRVDLYRSGRANAANVVAAEVDEHHVLSPLFLIRQKLLSKVNIIISIQSFQD